LPSLAEIADVKRQIIAEKKAREPLEGSPQAAVAQWSRAARVEGVARLIKSRTR
jgi:hypothetical protein